MVLGSILPWLVGVLVLIAIGWAFGRLRSIRVAKALHQRCVDELRDLLELMTRRHQVLSHLSDSMPRGTEALCDRTALQRRLATAEEQVRTMNRESPDPDSLRKLEAAERGMTAMVLNLKNTLRQTASHSSSRALAGCLDAFEKRTWEMLDAASTYNAAAITYSTLLEASPIARRYCPPQFATMDLELIESGIWSDSSGSGDRVAS